MRAIEFEEQNLKIAEEQDQFETLPAHYDESSGIVTTCWKLELSEVKRLVEDGVLYLQVQTGGEPLQPLRMTVENPVEDDLLISVGTTMQLKTNVLGNAPGDIGVCYEVYELGGRRGWSFIFPNGEYDGFSPDDIERCFALNRVGRVHELANYEFDNVIKLNEDFRNGVFDKAWEE